MMTEKAWPLLIVAIMLAAFFPAFSAEICNVDDAGMIQSLQHVTHWHLVDIFTPGASGGLYYRPLLALTFFINKSLFGLNPFVLHAENVLLHLVNTLLVYHLTRLLLTLKGRDVYPGYAFVGSLLFGLHPMVTESVNWISGRTDLLMGFFLLLSVLFLVQFRMAGRRYLLFFAAFCFLCALLSKELAIAFLPGFFLILYAKTSSDGDQQQLSGHWTKKAFLIIGVALLVIGTFFTLRTLAFTSDSSRIGLTLQYMLINPEHSFFLFLRATGFYLKKLLIPWPLNFAIVEVDPLYELVAIPLVLICLYFFIKGGLTSALFVTGLFLFTPALLIALNQIAWTPYAERYLYSTTAFTGIAAVMYCDRYPLFMAKKWRYIVLSIFLVAMALTTVQRNFVWQTNERILGDTAKKALSDSTVQWLYGASLLKKGDYKNALVFTQRAVTHSGSPLYYNPIPEINLGHIFFHLGKISEAIAVFEAIITKSDDESPEAHRGLIDCYRRLWEQAADKDQQQEYFEAMQTHSVRLFQLRPDPMVFYNLGKYAMVGKAYAEAGHFFRQAVTHMPKTHEYLPFAKKLADRFSPRT